MKNLLFVLCFLFGINLISVAQDFEKIAGIEFKQKSDFKSYETEVLQCANYILQQPNDKDNVNRLLSLQTVIKWMSGTPDYTFAIDESIGAVMKKNDDVLGVYMAAMTKFVLENPDQAKDQSAVKLNAFAYLLDYCANPVNKIKQTKELEKAIEAKKDDKLKEYLSIK